MSPKGTACPGCGKVRQTRNGKICYCAECIRGTGALPGGSIQWMLQEAGRMRAGGEAPPPPDKPSEEEVQAATEAYKLQRAARHPWLTRFEAAAELGLSDGRVSQLISDGTLTPKPGVAGRCRWVSALDVYNYQPRPTKKRNAA